MSKDDDIAGSANTGRAPEVPPINIDTAREIFPVTFDKDFSATNANGTVYQKDYRPREAGEGADEAPKAISSVQGSVTTQISVTGLEDVSEEDLASPVK